ncbi:Tetracycline resistance protein [Durusdinium trenchii]|uniref:Class B (TetA(B)) (Metal-tetracycline/H(+) antiporter) n=1 Tax=Durusdinium trenchii TaxID=1381693 RepID=A0ABP0RG23_9DINO
MRSSRSVPGLGVSPLWLLEKAKNHTGYGYDGRVNPGEVQCTAVSGDTPDWFVGLRTMEGPFHCNTVPVRRCPDVNFRSDGRLIYTKKTYHQGHFLDISEIHRSYDTKGRRVGEPKRSAAREVLGLPLLAVHLQHMCCSTELSAVRRPHGMLRSDLTVWRVSSGANSRCRKVVEKSVLAVTIGIKVPWGDVRHQWTSGWFEESVLCCLTFADCASMLLHSVALSCLLITEATLDLPSCSDWDADWDACLPDDDKLLLQTGSEDSAWAETVVNGLYPMNSTVSADAPMIQRSELGNLTLFTEHSFLAKEARVRSVLESGVKFGPKTSAALFLLLSCTLDRIGVNPAVGREDMEDVWESDELRILSRMMGTFGFACLCGNAKPFITAPYSEFPEEEESEEVRQQSLVACYFVVFMDAFGFGVYAPFVPVLAKTFSLQLHDIATVLAVFSLAQALNTPILGYLSDRFGRRPVLLVALAAESLSYLILSVAESFTCLLVGYIFAGAFCATIGSLALFECFAWSQKQKLSVLCVHVTRGLVATCSGEAVWEKEYAAPWMLVLNALGVVGYQIVSMIFVAYQVLFRRKFIMVCWHGKLETWQLWTCEYTKAYTRFFPLVAILISMSACGGTWRESQPSGALARAFLAEGLVRSMILIQRMYYELLRRGALLTFKEYKVTQEPIFYVLTLCFVQGASNFVMEALVPLPPGVEKDYVNYMEPDMLHGTKQWFVYLVIPITTFILSIYFTHEPGYALVPLSRYIYTENTDQEAQVKDERLGGLIILREENLRPICKSLELPHCNSAEQTDQIYQELIQTTHRFQETGSVVIGKKQVSSKFAKSQITDRFWPARFLLRPGLQDERSRHFRCVSRCVDCGCVAIAGSCIYFFAEVAASEFRDVQKGEIEDSAALVVEVGHMVFAAFYIYRILRTAQ